MSVKIIAPLTQKHPTCFTTKSGLDVHTHGKMTASMCVRVACDRKIGDLNKNFEPKIKHWASAKLFGQTVSSVSNTKSVQKPPLTPSPSLCSVESVPHLDCPSPPRETCSHTTQNQFRLCARPLPNCRGSRVMLCHTRDSSSHTRQRFLAARAHTCTRVRAPHSCLLYWRAPDARSSWPI